MIHSSVINNKQYSLSKEFYTSKDVFEAEKKQIFYNNWICVGLSNELPHSGDRLAVKVIDVPILLIRHENGDIGAFHNLCSHRGIQLVVNPCLSSNKIVCPYHAWSYSLDGKLQSTPHFKEFGTDRVDWENDASKDLKRISCCQWLGLIFVNLSKDTKSFDLYVDPLKERWSYYNLKQLCYGQEITYNVTANWKLALENFSESYHFPFVHPHLNEYSKMEEHYTELLKNNWIIQGISSYSPEPINSKNLPVFSNLSSDWKKTAEYVVFFPNLMIGIHPDHAWFLISEPITVTTSKERLIFYFVGEESLTPQFDELREAVIKRWDRINREDIAMVERLQMGHLSPEFDGGCFSPSLEKALQHFHLQIRDSLQPQKTNHKVTSLS